MVATVASFVCCFIALGMLECDSSGLAATDEKLDESVVIDVAPPWPQRGSGATGAVRWLMSLMCSVLVLLYLMNLFALVSLG